MVGHMWPPPEPSDRHSWYRCPELGSALVDGVKLELRRCVFQCRKDKIPSHPSKRSPHMFTLPQDQDDGFPQNAQERLDLRTQERLRNAVVDAVALLSLKLQIPVTRLTKPALTEFMVSMIKIGRSVQASDVEQMVTGFSTRTISERINRFGHLFRERDFTAAREHRYVNIAVDAGTVLGVAVIHSLLTNPYSEKFPIVLDIVENEHFDKYLYRGLFERVCSTCHEQGLVVCSIITDGLPAQVSGLQMLLNEDESVNTVYHIHCFAHLTNLVFGDSLNQSGYLRSILRDISKVVNLLRKPIVSEELAERCPSICPTRWLYLYDVLMWMYKRRDKLNAFLVASENNRSPFTSIPCEWIKVLAILTPLKALCLAVESSQCALWEMVPLVSGVMDAWRELAPKMDVDMSEVLRLHVANFLERFGKASNTTVITAFTLTEQGRECLRRKEVGFQTIGSVGESCFTTERIQSMGELHLEELEQLILEGSNTRRAGESDVSIEEIMTELEANTDDATPTASDTSLHRLSLDRLIQENVYKCEHAVALAELTDMGRRLGVPPNEVEEKFRTWIYCPRSDSPTRYSVGESPNTIWRRVPAISEDWRQFADVALRFVTMGTSEADCERSLSRQKDIQGLHTTNIRVETLEARLRA